MKLLLVFLISLCCTAITPAAGNHHKQKKTVKQPAVNLPYPFDIANKYMF
jgi:hypothetical protein